MKFILGMLDNLGKKIEIVIAIGVFVRILVEATPSSAHIHAHMTLSFLCFKLQKVHLHTVLFLWRDEDMLLSKVRKERKKE